MTTPKKATKILYVEDNEMNRLLVRRLLEPRGYQLFEANDGISGVKLAEEIEPDLILMDINLPLLDGHAATTRIKSIERLAGIPIIALTSNVMEGDRQRSLVAGCDGYIKKPLDVDEFPGQIEGYLRGNREKVEENDEQVFYKEYSAKLVLKLQKHIEELEEKNQKIEQQSKEMREAYLGIILSFVRAVEEKHSYTAGHSARVRSFCLKIGEKLQLDLQQMENLGQGALLHDIGKLVVEISSLKNVTGLSDLEWEEMKKHPEIGYKILKPIKFLSGIVNMVHQHHERWDGKGYPQGLKGDQIDFLASIVAVADSYDAMTSQRGYNKVLTVEEVIDEFRKCSGTKYNPVVVDGLIAVLADIRQRDSSRVH
ncbi:response regulator [bacterium]|nr:response regulator [bacterium]